MNKKLLICVCILAASIFLKLTDIPTPTLDSPIAFYSNQSQKDLKNSLIKSLKNAHSEIKISVYSLSDPDVIKILNKKSLEGLKITIQIDKKQAKSLRKKLSEKIDLSTVKQSGLMHQKVFLIDNICYLGSSNLTSQSLRMHDNLMLGLCFPKLNKYLKSYLFEKNQPLQDFRSPNLDLYLLPNKGALNRVLDCLNKAQDSIKIAMFTFTHPQVLDTLIKAQKRGVKVYVIFDYLSHKGASRFMAQKLKEASIPIFHNRGLALMHHKLAFIDCKTLITGSTNWTKSGFEKNQESLIVIEKLSTKDKRFIKTLWRNLKWESKKI